MNVYTGEPFEGAHFGFIGLPPCWIILARPAVWDLVFVRKMFVVSTKMTRNYFYRVEDYCSQ